MSSKTVRSLQMPTFQSVSGTGAFDRAAVDSIRNSAPFEHLPSSVLSRHIKFRVVFYYNLPVDQPAGDSHSTDTKL
jgi:hypothetical protein